MMEPLFSTALASGSTNPITAPLRLALAARLPLADQLDLGIPGDPHMDGQEHPEQQQCDDEIDREGRQSGERFEGEHGDICLRRLPLGEAGLTT